MSPKILSGGISISDLLLHIYHSATRANSSKVVQKGRRITNIEACHPRVVYIDTSVGKDWPVISLE